MSPTKRRSKGQIGLLAQETLENQLDMVTRELPNYKGTVITIQEKLLDFGLVYIGLSKKSHKSYLLRIKVDDSFPLNPPSFIFVDAHSKRATMAAWPSVHHFFGPGGTEFPEGWICLEFTAEFKSKHLNSGKWDPELKKFDLKRSLMEIIEKIM